MSVIRVFVFLRFQIHWQRAILSEWCERPRRPSLSARIYSRLEHGITEDPLLNRSSYRVVFIRSSVIQYCSNHDRGFQILRFIRHKVCTQSRRAPRETICYRLITRTPPGSTGSLLILTSVAIGSRFRVLVSIYTEYFSV